MDVEDAWIVVNHAQDVASSAAQKPLFGWMEGEEGQHYHKLREQVSNSKVLYEENSNVVDVIAHVHVGDGTK